MKRSIHFAAELGQGLLISVLMLAMIYYSEPISRAVIEAENRCLNIIIPSLFTFMTLSQLCLHSPAAEHIVLPFFPIYRFLLRMPPRIFFVLLMSNISGYPTGAKLISELFADGELSEKDAEKLLCVCYGGGPAFFIGSVGLAVFGSVRVGLAVFISVFAANLILSVFISRTVSYDRLKTKTGGSPMDITSAVTSSGRALLTVSLMIILFEVILSVIEAAGLFSILGDYLPENMIVLIKTVLELTSVTELSGMPYRLLPVISGLCSFGGICVLLQVRAVLNEKLSMKRLLIFRCAAAVISALICKLIAPFLLPEALMAQTQQRVFVKIDNFVPSICLILMIFLLNFKKSLLISKRI